MKRRMVLLACGLALVLAAAGCASSEGPEPTPGQVGTVDLGKGVSLEMVWVPGGTFTMGSPESELERDDDEGPAEKEVSGFWMGKYEVTQRQYDTLMGTNPSLFKKWPNPVDMVSWHEALEFCHRLEQRTGRKYSLPTEAQWEYACRAGTQTPFYTGETLSTDQANFDGKTPYGKGKPGIARTRNAPVGSFPPNAFGLYDMHGNVWEWCLDHYDEQYYTSSPRRDPPAAPKGSEGKETDRAMRGGSTTFDPGHCRSACRGRGSATGGDPGWGFRVVCLSRSVVDENRRRPAEETESPAPAAKRGKADEDFSQDLGGGVALDMVWVPDGTFDLGTSFGDTVREEDEGFVGSVSMRAFWVAKHETTVGEFRRFVEETNYQTEAEKAGQSLGVTAPSGTWVIGPGLNWRNPGFPQTDRHPVVHVTWNDASAFCSWLKGKAGREFRLPTETEWEYACRAGMSTAYQWGDDAADGAGWLNAADESAQKQFPGWTVFPFDDGHVYTAPVGSFEPNAFGLCDMHGNVWEWCFSVYNQYEYYDQTKHIDQSVSDGPRIFRGGSWAKGPTRCRSAFRGYANPTSSDDNVGFRVVCDVGATK